MQYIKQELTSFISSNLVDTYADWNATTTYILETDEENLTNASVVKYGSYYYRSLTNNNLNYNPAVYVDIKWVIIGISNKDAMLDLSANTRSIKENGDIVVVFEQNYYSSLGIGNYDASNLTIEVLATDMNTVLWQTEYSGNLNLNVYDYYSYIYEPYALDQNFTIKVEIPIIGKYIRLTFVELPFLSRSSCGYLILGTQKDMGRTLMPVKFNYSSFTTKEVNSDLKLVIAKKGVQDLIDFETVIKSTTLARMRREIKYVYDDIVLFVMDERDNSPYENIMTLGVIQDSSVILENQVESIVSFSIMEAL